MDGQLAQYTEFIESLVSNKDSLVRHHGDIADELEQYAILQQKIAELQRLPPTGSMRTHVDLGQDVFVQARISPPDTSTIIVHCGLDVYLELPSAQALVVCEQRSELLNRRSRHLQEQIQNITADIEQGSFMLQKYRELVSADLPGERE